MSIMQIAQNNNFCQLEMKGHKNVERYNLLVLEIMFSFKIRTYRFIIHAVTIRLVFFDESIILNITNEGKIGKN
jgi:hypothetical protein